MDSSRPTRIVALVLLVVVGLAVGSGAAVIDGEILGSLNTDEAASIDGKIPLDSPGNTTVYVIGASDYQDLSDGFTLDDTVNVVTNQGNATFYSAGNASVTVRVDEIEGPWTNVTNVNADPDPLQINPEDKSQVTVGNEIDSFNYTGSYGVDDGTVDFVYAGSVGQSRVTISGVPADTALGAVDADTGTVLDVATSDGSGSITFDALDNSEHAVLLQSGTAPSVSNANPTGDLSTPPSDLSVDVADADFPGDTVTVEFSLDGSVVGTQTTSTNGTVTQSVSNPAGGTHSWSIDVSDEYGNTLNDSYSFRVPTNLTVREETPNHDVIDHKTIEATCYEDVETNPVIKNLTTGDGKLDLTGFPTGSGFACQLYVPEYHNRTILLDSLYDQQNAFLVNKTNTTTVENRFVVSDRTGKFPPEDTEIVVQHAINQSLYSSGGFDWLAAAGDDLGADEAFVTDLREEKRYRIVVRNEDGDTRVLGAYTAESTGTIELNIGSVTNDPEAPNQVGYNVTWSNATGSSPTIRAEYNDTTQNTSTIYVKIYEWKNESNVLVSNTSYSGPFGQFTFSESVPSNQSNTRWVVKIVADRDTENLVIKEPVGPGGGNVLAGMPGWMVAVLSMGFIWMLAGLFSQLNGGIGGVVVSGFAAMLWWVGFTPPVLGGGVVLLSMLTGAIMFVNDRRDGGL